MCPCVLAADERGGVRQQSRDPCSAREVASQPGDVADRFVQGRVARERELRNHGVPFLARPLRQCMHRAWVDRKLALFIPLANVRPEFDDVSLFRRHVRAEHSRGAVSRVQLQDAIEGKLRLARRASPEGAEVKQHLSETEPGFHVVGVGVEHRAIAPLCVACLTAKVCEKRFEERAIVRMQAIAQSYRALRAP
jgi:hypothetical protein